MRCRSGSERQCTVWGLLFTLLAVACSTESSEEAQPPLGVGDGAASSSTADAEAPPTLRADGSRLRVDASTTREAASLHIDAHVDGAMIDRDVSTTPTDASAHAADACDPPVLFLVPWAWAYGSPLSDGGFFKSYCANYPDSSAFRVWLFQQGALVHEEVVACSIGEFGRRLPVSGIEPGEYEVAILNEVRECADIGAGLIPVESAVTPVCPPGTGSICNPITVSVAECGTSTVEFEMRCMTTGCDDACGGA